MIDWRKFHKNNLNYIAMQNIFLYNAMQNYSRRATDGEVAESNNRYNASSRPGLALLFFVSVFVLF